MAQNPVAALNSNQVTDQMIKLVLDELFMELDDDDSGTMEKNEVQDYSYNMLKKLRPTARFSQSTFDQNFNRLDSFNAGWVNRDTLFRFVL
mmetsp:Transcript_24027/g.29872  ORF Transcript_24027/g.29872 Transcript_24027/m.29872 type:complete len:91 (+) Transcript_24027:58-330(+)